MPVVVGAASDAGRIRPDNEDRYVVLAPPELAAVLDAVLVVADGMGGHQAGEVASGIVVDRFAGWFGRIGVAEQARSDWPAALAQIIREANREVWRAAAADPRLRGMGSTATVALIARQKLYLGHVGDSRAYLIRGATVHQLTHDHSWVAEQVRAGRLAASDAQEHPHRNVLTRAVGGGPDIEVDTGAYELVAGDHVLLCSDGLSNLVSGDELSRLVWTYGQPGLAAEKLVELANERGAPDNVTAVVARIRDGEQADDAADSITRVLTYRRAPRRGRGGLGRQARMALLAVLLLAIIIVIALVIWGDELSVIVQPGAPIN